MGILKNIQQINDERTMDTIHRRITKISEELGELSEAYLSASSKNNSKKKELEDIREEAIDVAIVAIDVALTPFMDNEESPEKAMISVKEIFNEKLEKWTEQRKNKQDLINVK